MTVSLTGHTLTTEDLDRVAGGADVVVSGEARDRIGTGRERLLRLAGSGKVVIYGTSTGVGVHKEDCLQGAGGFARAILHAHATRNSPDEVAERIGGGGTACPPGLVPEVARLVRQSLTVLVNHYCTGHTGVSLALADSVVAAVNRLHSDGAFARAAADELFDALDLPSGAAQPRCTDIDTGAIVANSAVAVWFMRATGYVPRAGEALPLMSYNALGLVSAWSFAHEMRKALDLQALACAATVCALGCDPAPFSEATLRTMPGTPEAAAVTRAAGRLLEFTGAEFMTRPKRGLQDPLSVRCFAVPFAAATGYLRQLEGFITHALNTNPINPIVCEDAVSTSPMFDPSGLRLGVDVARLALAEVATRSYSRMVNTLDPGHNGDLPRGLGQIHNCNIPAIASSALAALSISAATGAYPSIRMADGVEDVCGGLSHSCAGALALCRHAATLATCEFVVAFEAAVCRASNESGADPRPPSRAGTIVPPLLDCGRLGAAARAVAGPLGRMRDPDPREVADLGDIRRALSAAIAGGRAAPASKL